MLGPPIGISATSRSFLGSDFYFSYLSASLLVFVDSEGGIGNQPTETEGAVLRNKTDPSGKGWATWLKIGLGVAGIFTGGGTSVIAGILTIGGVGSTSSGPWSEQIPYSMSGGINTGGVFGGGSSGGGVFSFGRNESIGGPGPSYNPYDRAYVILLDFLMGNILHTNRHYTNDSVEGQDLMRSRGFQEGMQGIQKTCQAGGRSGAFNLGTFAAAGNIPHDILHSPTGVQVGGFTGNYAVRGNSVDINIKNDLTVSSLLAYVTAGYHFPSLDRPTGSGPLATIHQTFNLKVKNPCAN